jgi:hypothetical protein
MGAMTNLLVKDDTTTTRVELTFYPVTDTPTPFWRTRIAGVPSEGQARLYVKSETLKDGNEKITKQLEVPVMETLGASGTAAGYIAAPKVAYVNKSWHTHVIDKRSVIADRANLLALSVGLLQGATSVTATGLLDQSSAADAFKGSTAPVTLAFVQGELPF